MLKVIVTLLIFVSGATSFAGDPIKEVKQGYNDNSANTDANASKPDWTEGVHLIAGAGLNSASYVSDIRSNRLGLGANLRSDIGYYFENGMGLELSSSVMFNRVPQGLIWTSAFMVGVRFAVPPILPIEDIVPYARLFAGRSLNIVDYDGTPDAPYNSANRLQIQGTVTGFGIGHFQRGDLGRVWYLELTLERHSHETIEAIADNNGVPMVISGSSDDTHGVLYALCLTFGAVMF